LRISGKRNILYLIQYFHMFCVFSASKLIMGFFIPASSTVNVYVLDSVRTNNMPNMNNLLNAEREKRYVEFK
jgi:DNA polymerase epsilon subunit 1